MIVTHSRNNNVCLQFVMRCWPLNNRGKRWRLSALSQNRISLSCQPFIWMKPNTYIQRGVQTDLQLNISWGKCRWMFPSDAVCGHVISVPLQNLSVVTPVGLASLDVQGFFFFFKLSFQVDMLIWLEYVMHQAATFTVTRWSLIAANVCSLSGV